MGGTLLSSSSASSSSTSSSSSSSSLSTANLFSIPTASSSSSFVFGQKLHERVANHVSSASAGTTAETFANGGSPTDNMFTVIAKKEKSEADSTSTSKSLNDSAREL